MPVLEVKQKHLTVRKPRTAAKPAPVRQRTRASKLPGWGELAAKGEQTQTTGQARGQSYLERVSTVKFALLILAVAAAFTLYVGHVYATQDLLSEVQRLRKDNERLHMKYNRLKGEFDHRIGPAVIYERARALGLEEDIQYGPTIKVEPKTE